MPTKTDNIFIISALAEWEALVPHFHNVEIYPTPLGEFFHTIIADQNVLFFHAGWGKVAAAASTQYTIDHWHPTRIINLGTCGGIKGRISRGEIFLAKKNNYLRYL